MSYATRPPSGRLRRFVSCFWRVDESALVNASHTPEAICPDGCTEIILHLGNPMLQAVNGRWLPQGRYLLVTQMDGPVTIVPTGGVAMIGARLRAGALHRLLPTAQDRLAGQVLDLDTVWHEWTRRTAEQVSAAAPDCAFDVFERALEALVPTDASSDMDRALASTVSWLQASGGRAPIERLACHVASAGANSSAASASTSASPHGSSAALSASSARFACLAQKAAPPSLRAVASPIRHTSFARFDDSLA